MTPKETGTAELRRRADEIDWRHLWLANVMIDTGNPGPAKIARPAMLTRRTSLARRLHKLRRMRAALGPPR
jgi:hypothetical protein